MGWASYIKNVFKCCTKYSKVSKYLYFKGMFKEQPKHNLGHKEAKSEFKHRLHSYIFYYLKQTVVK